MPVLAALFLNGAAARWQAENGGEVEGAAPGWIDRAVGRDARVSTLYVDARRCLKPHPLEKGWIAMWRAEIFNRSVGPIVSVGRPMPDRLATLKARIEPGGAVVARNGRAVHAPLVLVDSRLRPSRGTLVAGSAAEHLALWRVDGPLRLATASRASAVSALCARAARPIS